MESLNSELVFGLKAHYILAQGKGLKG